MKLFVVLGQRKCRYAGEYAPEALDVADEFTADENPWSWLDKRLEHHRKDSSFSAVGVLTVHVPDAAVDAVLNPPLQECEGTVEK